MYFLRKENEDECICVNEFLYIEEIRGKERKIIRNKFLFILEVCLW